MAGIQIYPSKASSLMQSSFAEDLSEGLKSPKRPYHRRFLQQNMEKQSKHAHYLRACKSTACKWTLNSNVIKSVFKTTQEKKKQVTKEPDQNGIQHHLVIISSWDAYLSRGRYEAWESGEKSVELIGNSDGINSLHFSLTQGEWLIARKTA